MERPVLTAEIRKKVKKGFARKLRAKGLIPAIFYGPHTDAIPLAVNPKELIKVLQTEAGGNVLIDLEIRNGDGSDRRVVMVKELQYDHLQTKLLHVDFYEVAMDEMVTVEVPIRLVGRAEGVKSGGILEQVRRAVEIQCLPGDIPKYIDVDVSALKIGDSIHVHDLKIEKVKIIADTNYTIATVVPPAAEEKKPAEEVAAEAAPGAEVKKEETKGEEK